MTTKTTRLLVLYLFVLLIQTKANEFKTDICVYGGTSAGVIAAVSAHRLGKKVILIEPSMHIGGLSASGLGQTDIGNKKAITGIARDFYRRLGKYYGETEKWTFEPHVAELVFNDYLKAANIKVEMGLFVKKVKSENKYIKSVIFERVNGSGTATLTIHAAAFIDCTYEGDLMAKANVKYTVGREANSTYSETLNGVQLGNKHQFPDNIDPYKVSGKKSSGLLFGISKAKLKPNGTGDKLIQAYNYRLCLTSDKANQLPITAPANYNPENYELLRRVIARRVDEKWKHFLKSYFHIAFMPNSKTDMNNFGPFSTDFIGANKNYVEANYTERLKIAKEHADYCKGLLWFLAYDPSVPIEISSQMREWGYPKDEFIDNVGFPHQLYVREARRMKSDYIMTEHNCTGKYKVDDGIGLAAYTMDSHNCQRIVINGMVKNEGDVQVGGFPPYPVSYRSIIPSINDCFNLLVPVCLSATHIAYGSIRMEPVFMVLAQSAALAASISIDNNQSVQKVDVKFMQQKLAKDPLFDGSQPIDPVFNL